MATAAAATLTQKFGTSRDSTKDLRLSDRNYKILNRLITRILAGEDNLEITLADVSSIPFPNVDSDGDKPQGQVSGDSLRFCDMEIDSRPR